jgi:hypothetical protein
MAQDWSFYALVYFCSAVDDLLGAVLHRHLDLEFVDMKTLIEMAREAGFVEYKCDYCQIVEPVKQMIAAAVAREREACAKVCDDHWNKSIDCGDKAGALQCVGIRTAIRARGQA